jgi:hypothetical protein
LIGGGYFLAKVAIIVHLADKNLFPARPSSLCFISERYFVSRYNYMRCRIIIPPTFGNSGMNYQQRNRALFECIRERCARTVCNPNVSLGHDADFTLNLLFYVKLLFFRYGPLCMSLHDAVADDSCSDLTREILDP